VPRWPSSSAGGANWSPGLLDRAETFTESDLTLSYTGTEAVNGAVDLSDVIDLDGGGGTTTQSDTTGVSTSSTFTHDVSVCETLYIQISGHWNDADGTVRAIVDGNTVVSEAKTGVGSDAPETEASGTVDVSGVDSVDVVYEAEITAVNDTYAEITVNYEGNTYTGLNSTVEGQDVLDGSVVVEWPMPEDLAGWDIIPFEATADGGMVEVYAVDPSDGTRLAGPLDDPGDISDISRSTNIAVEVVLSRPSTSENPRLEAVYRRRKIT